MISILFPIYNGEKYLKDSIESVLNQTFSNFEILIGFNGTSDSSKNIISDYKDNRIRIFDYSDSGKAKTLNKLIKEAKYNWLAVQDDDDVWEINKLEEQIKYCNDYDVIGVNLRYIDEYSNEIGSLKFSETDLTIKHLSLYGNNQIASTGAIFKKDKAINVNCWDENIDGIEDYDFWLKLIKADCKFINLQQFLLRHRLHTSSNFNTKQHNILELLNKYR
jgi:glycosyltransferase involved in cell wall biosynthesis